MAFLAVLQPVRAAHATNGDLTMTSKELIASADSAFGASNYDNAREIFKGLFYFLNF